MLAKAYNNDTKLMSDNLRQLLISIGRKRKIRKNTYLFQEGMDAKEIYLVQSGLIQIGKLTPDGKELSLRICKKDDLVGELTLFSDESKYMLSALALDDCDIITINKTTLEQELAHNNALTFEYMKWMSVHLRKTQSKIRDLLLNGKKGALYSTLIRLSNSYGVKQDDGLLIDIVLTNQELANFVASARESVNRMLSDLKKQKVISLNDTGKIIIHKIDFLRMEIGCENCPIEICNID
jgi:CRP-like cAMP-binding protein